MDHHPLLHYIHHPLHWLIHVAIGLAIGGGLLWGAIKIVDPENKKNDFLAAMGWMLLVSLVPLPFLGLLLLLVILASYYQLGFFKMVGVLIVEAALSFALLFVLRGAA